MAAHLRTKDTEDYTERVCAADIVAAARALALFRMIAQTPLKHEGASDFDLCLSTFETISF